MKKTYTVKEIMKWVEEWEIPDHIPEMERQRDTAVGFSYYIGQLAADAKQEYNLKCGEVAENLRLEEKMTDVLRQMKLKSMTAQEEAVSRMYENLLKTLDRIYGCLLQSIKVAGKER